MVCGLVNWVPSIVVIQTSSVGDFFYFQSYNTYMYMLGGGDFITFLNIAMHLNTIKLNVNEIFSTKLPIRTYFTYYYKRKE